MNSKAFHISFQQFEYILLKILSIHKNCIINTNDKKFCWHIEKFINKIGYQYFNVNNVGNKNYLPNLIT